jgi:hypothetical protein
MPGRHGQYPPELRERAVRLVAECLAIFSASPDGTESGQPPRLGAAVLTNMRVPPERLAPGDMCSEADVVSLDDPSGQHDAAATPTAGGRRRGRKPRATGRADLPESEKRKVWVRAGGVCVLRNRYLLDGSLTALPVSLGELAHVRRYRISPSAPRVLVPGAGLTLPRVRWPPWARMLP